MIKKRLGVSIIVLSLVMSLASCASIKTDETSKEVSESANTLATSTSESSTEPVVIGHISEEVKSYLQSNFSLFYSLYLLNEENAILIDQDVSDGFSAEGEVESIKLASGTIMFPADKRKALSADMSSDELMFVLLDGRCVVFEESKGSDGSVMYNGKVVPDMFGGTAVLGQTFTDRDLRKEGEVLSMTPLDPQFKYQNLTVNVDWNSDGYTDTFRRTCEDVDRLWESTVTYTDGATGKITDISDLLGKMDNGDYVGFTDELFLYENSSGNVSLWDDFIVCCGDITTFIYSYDPDKIITFTEAYGILSYEDGSLYLYINSLIFGNLQEIRIPAVLENNSLETIDSAVDVYWSAAIEAGKLSEGLPASYSCTFKEVPAEKIDGDAIVESTIPVGVTVFPQYYRIDEAGSGYFYFCLADGTKYRAAIQIDESQTVLFGETSQDELFWCGWGG